MNRSRRGSKMWTRVGSRNHVLRGNPDPSPPGGRNAAAFRRSSLPTCFHTRTSFSDGENTVHTGRPSAGFSHLTARCRGGVVVATSNGCRQLLQPTAASVERDVITPLLHVYVGAAAASMRPARPWPCTPTHNLSSLSSSLEMLKSRDQNDVETKRLASISARSRDKLFEPGLDAKISVCNLAWRPKFKVYTDVETKILV